MQFNVLDKLFEVISIAYFGSRSPLHSAGFTGNARRPPKNSRSCFKAHALVVIAITQGVDLLDTKITEVIEKLVHQLLADASLLAIGIHPDTVEGRSFPLTLI